MLRIGSLQLDSPLLLAPVAGHCDLPFRLTARSCGGIGLAYTDLLCPHGVIKQNKQTRWLMATDSADQPLGTQLYGKDPDLMCEAARLAVDHGAPLIDINMGCPVDKVTKTFAGAMMLCTADHAVELAQRLVEAVGDRAPVTAKMRLGYRHGELTAPELARRLIDVGIQCITIHGRTAEQRFKGFADMDGIAAVVDAVHGAGGGAIPCIGNGGIRTPYDAITMFDRTGCDGVMIARAALGAPWIFHDTRQLLTVGRIDNELTLQQRIEVIRQHARHMIAMRDAPYGLNRMRQKISGYAKHLGPSKALRIAMQKVSEPDHVDEALDRFLDEAGAAADAVPITWAQRHEQLQIEANRIQGSPVPA